MDPEIDYAKIHLPILFTKALTDGAKLLFVWFKFRGNSLGVVRWRYVDIAKEFGISERTIRRYTNELEMTGLIKVCQTDRHGYEIAIMPFTSDLLQALDAPTRWTDIRGGQTRMNQPMTNLSAEAGDDHAEPADLSRSGGRFGGTYKEGKETERKPDADSVGIGSEGRVPFDDVFAEPMSQSKPKTPWPKREPAPKAVPVVDDLMLARWTAKDWAKSFLAAMEERGYRVAFSNSSRTIQKQISGITDFLIERLGRMDSYKFLIQYFPQEFPGLCEVVFHKSAKDLGNFPLSWMATRLGEFVERFKAHKENEDDEKARPSKRIERLEWLE